MKLNTNKKDNKTIILYKKINNYISKLNKYKKLLLISKTKEIQYKINNLIDLDGDDILIISEVIENVVFDFEANKLDEITLKYSLKFTWYFSIEFIKEHIDLKWNLDAVLMFVDKNFVLKNSHKNWNWNLVSVMFE
jgi:hypothetical protein